MIRRIFSLLALVAVLLFAASCGQPASLVNMEYIKHEDGSYGSEIKWGDTVYTFWGAVDTDLIEKQIGIIDNDKDEKVFSVKGYSTDEWLIHHLDVIMSTYDLYKAEDVTEIPKEFEDLKSE